MITSSLALLRVKTERRGPQEIRVKLAPLYVLAAFLILVVIGFS